MAIYHVQDPQGQTHEIEGPDNASPEEVMKQARSLIPSKPGIMDILPDMIHEAAKIGAPNLAIQSVGDAMSPGGVDPNKNPMADTQGLQDVTIPDALQAAGAAGTALEALEGPAATAARYAGRFGENQMGKVHGTTPIQFRQLGRENFGPSMRSSYEAGDANLLQGPIGREQAINERINQLGSDIGDVRAQAGAAGPQMSPKEMVDAIRKDLNPDYMPGGKFASNQGELERQLANIEQMPEGGVEAFAQRSSAINKQAGKDKLLRPTSTDTDIADRMSRINDQTIHSNLPEDVGEHYEMLKDEFGNTKNLKPMEARGEAKEALGNAPNTVFGAVKKAAHTMIGGPKLGAQAGFGAETALEGLSGAGEAVGRYNPSTIGGVTAHLMSRLSSNPQSLGRYATPLLKAAQTGGNQGLAATHYLLSSQYPDYNALMSGQDEQTQ